jgi:ribosome-associated protein
MQDITIGPNGIRLGQFLKFVNAVPTGGEVKALLESCDVSVNGRTEVRRGAQLTHGDVVAVGASSWRIS